MNDDDKKHDFEYENPNDPNIPKDKEWEDVHEISTKTAEMLSTVLGPLPNVYFTLIVARVNEDSIQKDVLSNANNELLQEMLQVDMERLGLKTNNPPRSMGAKMMVMDPSGKTRACTDAEKALIMRNLKGTYPGTEIVDTSEFDGPIDKSKLN